MFKDEEINSERMSDLLRRLMCSIAAYCLPLFDKRNN